MGARGRFAAVVILLAVLAAAAWLALDRSAAEREGVAVDGDAPASGADDTGAASHGGRGEEETKQASLLGRRIDPETIAHEPASVSGRVVDEARAPVAGARVSLRVPDLPEAATTAGPDGRFRLEVKLPEGTPVGFAGGLHAVDDRGRAGVEIVRFVAADAAAATDGPTVEIRPARIVRVTVRTEGAGAGTVAGARVLAWSAPQQGIAETGVRVADAVAGSDGVARLDGVPTGPLAIVAIGPDGRRSRTKESLVGAKDLDLVLELDRVGRVGVRVVTEGDASRSMPVASARVEAFRDGGPHDAPIAFHPPLEAARTNGDGFASVEGLVAGEPVLFRVTVPDTEPVWVEPSGLDVGGMVLRVPSGRGASWDVVAQAGEPPRDGTPVAVRLGAAPPPRPDPTERRAWIRSGHLVLEEVPSGAWFATAWLPDGRVATLAFGLDERGVRPAATFRPPRRLVVRIVDEAGAPVSAIPVRLELEGRRASEEAVTDAEGRATVLTPFGADQAGVEAGMVVGGTDFVAIGRVGEAGKLELAIPSRRETTVRVRVDDEPRLPQGLRVDWSGALEMHVDEDASRGAIRVSYRPAPDPDDANELHLSAPGVATTKVRLPGRADRAIDEVEARLARTVALLVHVTAPPGYRATPTLFRLEPTTPVYRPGPVAEGGALRWDPLPVGDYEVRDAGSGITSGSISVKGTSGLVEASLDLTDLVRVRGRVEVSNAEFGWFGVVVQDEASRAAAREPEMRGVDEEGRFDFWLPSLAGYRIRAYARRKSDLERFTGPPKRVTTNEEGVVLAFE